MSERRGIQKVDEYKLPKEEVCKQAPELLNKALLKLYETPELKDALAKRYISQGIDPTSGQRHLVFNKGEYQYTVTLNREVTNDRLDIEKNKNNITEGITLWLEYDEHFDGSCKLFPGSRGSIHHAVVAHKEFDWSGKSPMKQYINSQEALSKSSKFIEEL
jgi:hypothetical protein